MIDDQEGHTEAERRLLIATGTLGILAEAHRRLLLDFETVLKKLRQTNFYTSAELIDLVRRRLAGEP